MSFEVTGIDIWAGEIEDRPGALNEKLGQLASGGANLEFAIVRPSADSPGHGVLFVAPLEGAAQMELAVQLGLHKSERIHAARVSGPDRPGLLADLSRILAESKINICGLSAAAVGDRCVFYFRFETVAAARQAADVFRSALA